MPSAGSLGEDGLVAGVIAAFAAASAPPGWLTVGPGDDAAVLDLAGLAAGSLVASTDTLVEDEDFRQHWSSPADIGVKTAAQNFADIAAMGARPAVLLVSLALPGTADAAFADGLAAGVADECARAGAVVAGGDVSQARQIVITGTALGVLPPGGRPVLRSGAQPGDVVAIAGGTGRSAAGLALLEYGYRNGTGPDADSATPSDRELDVETLTVVRALIADHQRPRPPYAAGPAAAAAGATALIDTSDGLIRDAGRIAAASGVTIDLDAAALTPSRDLEIAAGLLPAADSPAPGSAPGSAAGSAALTWVLTGGEDHALLATFPPEADRPAGFVVIGQVRQPADGDGPHVLVGGIRWDADPGWQHFRTASR